METENSTKLSIFRMFPGAFWSANAMEIFERMGWYGFYAVSTLYLTNAVADGGLGFTSKDRGFIQGLATFFMNSTVFSGEIHHIQSWLGRPVSGRWSFGGAVKYLS